MIIRPFAQLLTICVIGMGAIGTAEANAVPTCPALATVWSGGSQSNLSDRDCTSTNNNQLNLWIDWPIAISGNPASIQPSFTSTYNGSGQVYCQAVSAYGDITQTVTGYAYNTVNSGTPRSLYMGSLPLVNQGYAYLQCFMGPYTTVSSVSW
jgi:hypothetical protein